MDKIDLNKTYVTRDGRAARILCIDLKSTFPVVAAVRRSDGSTNEYTSTYTENGHSSTVAKHGTDLIEYNPWKDTAPDARVLFKYSECGGTYPGHFAGVDGGVKVWRDGRTSHTTKEKIRVYSAQLA